MRRKKYIPLIPCTIILLTTLLYQCSTPNTYSKHTSHKTIPIAKGDRLQAQFYFYKNSDTSAICYLLLNTDPLLFARLDTGIQFYASLKVTLYLYSNTKNTRSDSISKTFYIPSHQSTFFQSIHIPVQTDNYHVKITLTDQHKKQQYIYYNELLLATLYTRHNFLLVQNNKILFKPYVIQGSEVYIYHQKKFPQLQVDVFHYNHTPAPPPFANITNSFQYIPDSSFTIPISPQGYYTLTIPPNTYYHIRARQEFMEGITIFSNDSIFPNIRDAREMLYTSRYIMNKNEFERCATQQNTTAIKKCIDNFWIQIAGGKERAKELIKQYYQRVIDANRLFTSSKYGWQTDQGMIYIIFGPPEDIKKNLQSEKWYYSVNGQKNALIFNFHKNKNSPFSVSEYVLERSDYYKDIWYLTVDKIRQGRLTIK